MSKRLSALLATVLAMTMLLTACGTSNSGDAPSENGQNGAAEPFTVSVALPMAQDTLDPAKATAAGSETVLYHLYENLMRWEDDGSGFAQLAPGQAERYTVETDYAGNATYTFTLRDGIQWSDGTPVVAEDFVAAWRRLADPANELPHREMMEAVAGYDQPIPEDWEGEEPPAWDPAQLAVSAPNKRTFVVTLVGSSAYFLSEIAAGAHTMPVRTDLLEKGSWGDGKVTNGAYTNSNSAVISSNQIVPLQKSGSYYDAAQVKPEVLVFRTSAGQETDYQSFLDGQLDLVQDLPNQVLQPLAESGGWLPEPHTTTFGVLLNTQRPPFDDANIRLAFRLAIDNQAVVDALGDLTVRPAIGLVPYGVADYGEHPKQVAAAQEEAVLPDANATHQVEPAVTAWDFRAHSLEKVTVPGENDYASDCQNAQALLAQAGYPGGSGFPAVEYIYLKDSDADRAIAQALQTMWLDQLGVSVTLRGLSQEEYDAMLLPAEDAEDGEDGEDEESDELPIAPFALAGQTFTADFRDAAALLHLWYSDCPENWSGYRSDAFDILLDSAEAAVSFEARDAYLHDAEAILLSESPVIPICYQGGSYLLSDALTGLYRGPDGVWFLSGITPASN